MVSEYDNVDRGILYFEESCSDSDIEIDSMTVMDQAYNSNWIIAKSSHQRDLVKNKYWIVDKSFKVTIIQDNDSTITL